MHQEVILEFGPEGSWTVHLGDDAPMASDDARRWLDDEFLANDCAPIRATGKVLIADKLLIVARTVGAKMGETLGLRTGATKHSIFRAVQKMRRALAPVVGPVGGTCRAEVGTAGP